MSDFNEDNNKTNEEEVEVEVDEIIETEEVFEDKKRKKFYYKLRSKFEKMAKKNLSPKYEKIVDYLLALPDFFVLLARLAIDKRVPTSTKGFIALIIGYVMMPIDIIPDFIPTIGYLDDLLVVVYSLQRIINEIDEKVILDNWSGTQDVLELIQKIIDFADDVLENKILKQIRKWIKKNHK